MLKIRGHKSCKDQGQGGLVLSLALHYIKQALSLSLRPFCSDTVRTTRPRSSDLVQQQKRKRTVLNFSGKCTVIIGSVNASHLPHLSINSSVADGQVRLQ